MPTGSMLRCSSSASVRLQRSGHTALSTSTVTSVLLISAAPCAIFFACSNSFIAPSAVWSRKNHHTAAVRGMTLGWSPPLVMTRCARISGRMCSRYCAMPTSISTTPSSASRPFQGATPECAVSPWKVKVAEISADCSRPWVGAEFAADVVVEGEIDVVEPAVAHEIGPADELLLGRARRTPSACP